MTKENFQKIPPKNVAWKLVPDPFLYLRILCEKESANSYLLILTYFACFANSACSKNFIF